MAMLNMLVKCSSLETSFFGIRINAVAAGVTATQTRQKKESLGLTDAQNKQYLLEQA
jgi:NAD(P)-dependent dehydrogenase (short-subunit alcohol dehydrogenase family)